MVAPRSPQYAVAVARGTREAAGVRLGASPRASIASGPVRPGPRAGLRARLRRARRRRGDGRAEPGPPPARRRRRPARGRVVVAASSPRWPPRARERGGAGRPRPVTGHRAGAVVHAGRARPAWAAVAHNSGSGWVQALGGLLAGFAVVGLVGPGSATARLAGPRSWPTRADATAGRPVLDRARGRTAAARAGCAGDGPADDRGGWGSDHRRAGVVPRRRARLVTRCSLGGVLGRAVRPALVAASRVVVPLARPLWVAPVAGPPGSRPSSPAATGAPAKGCAGRASADGPVSPAASAPTSPGDPRRLVHWPATAHHGSLMVREVERPEDGRSRNWWSRSPTTGRPATRLAARALGTVLALAARRAPPVVLTTLEHDGPGPGPVLGTGRRRPAAGPGGRAAGPVSAIGRIKAANRPGPPEHSVVLRVSAAPAAVAVGIAACAAEGELSVPVAAVSIAAVVAGQPLLLPAPGPAAALAEARPRRRARSSRSGGSSSPSRAASGVTNLGRGRGTAGRPVHLDPGDPRVRRARAAATSPSAWPARSPSWPSPRPRPST